MFLNINKVGYRFLKWPLFVVVIFFIFAALTIPPYLIFENKYENKIYPNIYLGNKQLGGLTITEAKELITKQINIVNQEGIKFKYENKEINIFPTISSFDTELAYQIMSFNENKTSAKAFNYGRDNNFILNLHDKIIAVIFKKKINLDYEINEQEIDNILKDNFNEFEILAKNAELKATSTENSLGGNISFQIEEENIGKIINYEKSINNFKANLANLNLTPITLVSITGYPEIYKNECLNIEIEAEKIIKKTPLFLTDNSQEWIINPAEMAELLAIKRNLNNEIIIGLDNEKANIYFNTIIIPEVDKIPVNARFEITNGRVTEFQASQDGRKLNIEKNIEKIEKEFIFNDSLVLETSTSTINLIIEEIKSTIKTGEINDLGINEIIGTGQSNFIGSPPNRRHNINVGAEAVNGLLIKPEEEFSLVKALGDITAASGYLPELVIKGNKTIPEYGGGLCQIGTTIFRAALASGLPITARQNHSYRVSYYEPAGKDAAVYDPWPDVRFINDTNFEILIQSRIEGNDLYFDFWGTKDGRIIEQTDSVISNITKPSETKLVETLDLPVGEKKCTEHAHNGATAYFDYKVSYPDGEIKEKRFSSRYIPWQEVCLIGVEKLSEPIEEEIESE
ncbi:MAG: VanW family protein [Patescibacteria group bacterium]